MLFFINPFFLLVFLQLIQSEERGKAEVQESCSKAEEYDDAGHEEDDSGDKDNDDSSSKDDDQDGAEEASSDREINSPKVDIVG
jgi:hypothetical protein